MKRKIKKRWIVLCVFCVLIFGCFIWFQIYTHMGTGADIPEEKAVISKEDTPVVYFTSDISPESLVAIYEVLGREATGNIGVKINTGESENSNYLRPELIGDLVQSINGTIVESNTAYGGSRIETAMHMQIAADHGFTVIADVDILDSEGTMSLPVEGGFHLSEDIVGSHFADYDFYVIISHFKGHQMGGFGGALKNISIGFASPGGKNLIHTAGGSDSSSFTVGTIFGMLGFGGAAQDAFLESMADASKAVTDYMGDNILYINVMNRLSVDCDCSANPTEPDMHDIGILASFDPVALDQACVDMIYSAEDGASVAERIETRNGEHTLEAAEALGIGYRTYIQVNIDE